MSDYPLISTVTPTRNPERLDTLTRAVRSILAQSYPRLEAIVVADGAKATHVDELEKRIGDSRLRIVRLKEGRGTAVSRNAGARAARGEYLAFLDDDDEWLPNKIEVQMQLAAEHPEAALIFCDAYVVTEPEVLRFFEMSGFRGTTSLEEMCRNNFALCSTVIVKRAVIEALGGFDDSPGMVGVADGDLWGRMLHAGYRAIYSPLALVNHSQYADNYSKTAEFFEHEINLFEKHIRLFSDRPRCRALLGRRLASVRRYARSPRRREALIARVEAIKYLDAGRAREARALLVRSMRCQPLCLRNYAHWAFTYFPSWSYQAVRKLKRALLQEP
ncbi:MAG: glycosyltransferase family 2 protein [Acidobacteriota bacterium]|nr:MAG: glycosyltransferase family 2 protein [Acidobacteriota bacterium]